MRGPDLVRIPAVEIDRTTTSTGPSSRRGMPLTHEDQGKEMTGQWERLAPKYPIKTRYYGV